jgi:hypothetical protein
MSFPTDIYHDWPLNRIHLEWAILVSQDYRLGDTGFRSDVTRYARQMMRKAGDLFKMIIEQLDQQDYRFVNPNGPLSPPEYQIADRIAEFRNRQIFLPVALEAWLCEIGTIDLTGSHPDWNKSGYDFGDHTTMSEIIVTDAFVCDVTVDYVDYLYKEWLSLDGHQRIPFRIDFSPDHLHKANVSGGPPYQLAAQAPGIDALVLNERHCLSFVGLIRLALRWRGFPGFEQIPNEGCWSTIQQPVI